MNQTTNQTTLSLVPLSEWVTENYENKSDYLSGYAWTGRNVSHSEAKGFVPYDLDSSPLMIDSEEEIVSADRWTVYGIYQSDPETGDIALVAYWTCSDGYDGIHYGSGQTPLSAEEICNIPTYDNGKYASDDELSSDHLETLNSARAYLARPEVVVYEW